MGTDPVQISPTPTDEEAAAIVAALTMAWPRPAPPDDGPPAQGTAWRFSGRWWHKGRWRR